MLFSSFKGSMALVALNSLFFASSLWAETHYVEIHNGAFFPEVTYLYPGDQVEFINRSDAERSIEGEELVESGKKGKKGKKGKTETWESGKLGYDSTFTYSVHEGTLMTFTETEGNFVGQFSFDAPPLGDP